jgi:hypothetical protein
MSNLQGFLGKLEVTNEIGELLDKQLQLAEGQAQQYIGGSASFRLGAVKVGELGIHIDKDLEEGKLSFESELAAASYMKSYLRKASEVLLNLAEKSKNEELIAHGKVAALRESMEVVKKHCLSAKSRVEQLLAAAQEAAKEAETGVSEVEVADRRNRRPGQHPGPSSLDARRAERDALRSQDDIQAGAAPEQPLAEPTEGLEAVAVSDSTVDLPRVKRPYKRRQKPTE